MKNVFITITMLLSLTLSATEKDKTFFGNEYNSSELVTLQTAQYEIKVVKGSPLHSLYNADVTAFEMSVNNTIQFSTNPMMTFKSIN